MLKRGEERKREKEKGKEREKEKGRGREKEIERVRKKEEGREREKERQKKSTNFLFAILSKQLLNSIHKLLKIMSRHPSHVGLVSSCKCCLFAFNNSPWKVLIIPTTNTIK